MNTLVQYRIIISMLCIFLLVIPIGAVPSSGDFPAGYSMIPIPTRPPLYHQESPCDLPSMENETRILSVQYPGNNTYDSVWNVSVGFTKILNKVSRLDGEFNPDGTQREDVFTPANGTQYLDIPVQIQVIRNGSQGCFDISRFSLTNNQTGVSYPVHEVMDFLNDPFSGGNISYFWPESGSIVYQIPTGAGRYNFWVNLQDGKAVYLVELGPDLVPQILSIEN